MTHIAFYEARAFNPDNEAVHVTTSASPAEALSHRSALGMALYGAARTLGILAYPGQHEGVVFEGNLPTIDSLRPKLRFLAPEIAQRALANCTSGRENAGGLSQLTRVVEEFGDPLAGRRLTRGVAAGLGPFAARIHGLLGLDPQFSELLRGRLGRHASVPFRTPASSSVSRRARCLPTVPTTGSSTIARWSPSSWTTSRSPTMRAQPPSGSMCA